MVSLSFSDSRHEQNLEHHAAGASDGALAAAPPEPGRIGRRRWPFVVASLALLVVLVPERLSGIAHGQDSTRPRSAPRQRPLPRAQGDAPAQAAASLYRSYCARCHGADGSGQDMRYRLPRVPDFTSARWHGDRTDAQLRVSILDGKGSGMPSFGERLEDRAVDDLVAYIRQFGPAPLTPARSSQDNFERSLRQLEEELAELRQQFRELARPRPHRRSSRHDD
jgi:mono/diheme cytochrome c family protein